MDVVTLGMANAAARKNHLRRPVPTVWKLGDSISANGSTNPAGAADRIFPDSRDYLEWACLLSMGKLIYGGSAATGGYRTDQIITTWLPAVLAARPTFCVVHAGTNDIGTLTTAQTLANLKSIFDQLLAAGITPVATTMLPKETNKGSVREPLDTMSAFVTRYADLKGFPRVDWTTPFITTAGGWTGYTSPTPGPYNGDDVHPNGAGAKVMGQALADALSPLVATRPESLATNTNYLADFVQTRVNALFLTDTNADGVADQITATTATGAVYALTAMSVGEGNGNWQSLERTSTGSPTIETAAITVAPGDLISFSVKVKTSGMKTGGATWHLRLTTSSVVDVTAHRNRTEDITLGLWKTVFRVPAGVTSLKLHSYISAGTGKLFIGEINMVNLTAKGLDL